MWVLGSWFRFLVKHMGHDTSTNHPIYAWYEMTFFTKWICPDATTVFCFDLPQTLEERIRLSLSSNPAKLDALDHYSLHALIVDEIVDQFEASVWAMRDVIRRFERVRLGHTSIHRTTK